MSWRKITFIVVALIVLLGGSAALSRLFVSMKPEPPRRPNMEMKRYVKAEKIEYKNIYSEVLEEGRVVSSNELPLVAEASGKIEPGSVKLRKGASFKKGQLLATIYKDEIELALKARKSRFLTIITSLLPDLKVDYPEALDAFTMFFRAIDMDEDLPELPVIRNEKLKIFLASRNVLSEFYGIKQDEKRLKRYSLYAPFNGTFQRVNFEIGAFVNTGGQIARMIRTDEVEVEVPVIYALDKWIEIGDKVEIMQRHSTKPFTGTVVRKSAFVDANTQRRSAFVQVSNSGDRELLAGEYWLVKFPGQKIENAMEIPRSAVFNSNEVFTIVDGKLRKQEINVIKVNETTLIFNGLEEGLQVVMEPLINAKENTPVGIVGEESPQPKGNRKSKDNQPTTAKKSTKE